MTRLATAPERMKGHYEVVVVVVVDYKAAAATAETRMWHMPEDGKGRFVSPGAKDCD